MPAGNERKIESDEQLINLFLEYLEKCKKDEECPNKAGFATFLYISRNTLYRYEEDFYSDTMKIINNMLEDKTINCKYITDVLKKFILQNKHNYKDRVETENINHNTNNTVITEVLSMTAEQREQRIQELLKKASQ